MDYNNKNNKGNEKEEEKEPKYIKLPKPKHLCGKGKVNPPIEIIKKEKK